VDGWGASKLGINKICHYKEKAREADLKIGHYKAPLKGRGYTSCAGLGRA